MTIGIYCIEHIESGKKYIGKSKNIESRWGGHKRLLSKEDLPKGCNRYLYYTAQKYGLHNLSFYIVESFQILDPIMLADRELYWIDYYRTMDRDYGYNLKRQSSILTELSEESHQRMSESLKGSKNPNFGKKFSQETINKMIQSRSGVNNPNFGRIFSDITIGRMSKAKLGIAQNKEHALRRTDNTAKYSYIQMDLDGNYIQTFLRIKDAIAEGFCGTAISSVVLGRHQTHKGFRWSRTPKLPCIRPTELGISEIKL